ncbi:hypothetical protein WA026_001477 [Henosepilachna vigintioctopunctata]|uniref:C2H2-type domain-containing protein n=1 Tax=Henosepilachna vigintioctopunctata TaxID=420089 RepID=A0AAW1URB0_9CUCU
MERHKARNISTRLKKSLRNTDEYQDDLEAILYYTKVIKQLRNNASDRKVKEKPNIENCLESFNLCNIGNDFSQKTATKLSANPNNELNAMSEVLQFSKDIDCIVGNKGCDLKVSYSSELHANIESAIESNEKLSKMKKTKLDADCSPQNGLFNTEVSTQRCQLCEFSTNSASKFKHMNHHVKSSIYKCPYCTYQAVNSSQLDGHINSVHTKSNKYHCRYCNFIAKSFISSKNHIEDKHKKIVISGKIHSQNGTNFEHITKVLKTNDTKADSEKKNLKRQARIVTGVQFQCQFCEYQTPFSDYLNIHINSRHTRNVLYKCQYCEYTATKSYTLKCHVNSKHTKKVLYKCELCNLETTRADLLKRHIERIHVDKNFKCQYCDYVAKKDGHIKNHLKRKHLIQYKKENINNQVKIESDIIQIENIKFEPEFVKSENV